MEVVPQADGRRRQNAHLLERRWIADVCQSAGEACRRDVRWLWRWHMLPFDAIVGVFSLSRREGRDGSRLPRTLQQSDVDTNFLSWIMVLLDGSMSSPTWLYNALALTGPTSLESDVDDV